MSTRLKDCRHLPPSQQRPDRQSPAQGLGQRHHIRLHTVVLESEHFPGSAESALHLVEHQQYPVCLPDLRQGLHKLRGGLIDSALPLHRFHEDGHGLGVDGRSQGVDIIEGFMHEATGQWLEALPELGLDSGGQRPQGAPVERVGEGDDLRGGLAVLMAILAHQLDRRLVGLSPAVAEEDLVEAGQAHQSLGQGHLPG